MHEEALTCSPGLFNPIWHTMFPPAGKRCFTIESLVSKESPKPTETHMLPPVLNYPSSTEAFMNRLQSPASISLNPSQEFVYPETLSYPSLTVHPHQLGGPHIQHPLPFFGVQQRDQLSFYPWVIRNRFFGHRVQGNGKPSHLLFDFAL